MVSRRRWVSQELCGKLLPLYEQGFVFDNRYPHDFQRMRKQCPELKRLGQVYDREDQIHLESELGKASGGATRGIYHRRAALVLFC